MIMRVGVSDLPIRFESVSIGSRGVAILDRITLQIEAGPPTVLVGPNGSGKTTLLRTAMGLVSPTQGRITWGGVEESPPRDAPSSGRGVHRYEPARPQFSSRDVVVADATVVRRAG
jgi:ABC-type multidrug transport system ATPase subunit